MFTYYTNGVLILQRFAQLPISVEMLHMTKKEKRQNFILHLMVLLASNTNVNLITAALMIVS